MSSADTARGRVREAGGDELVARLDHLDALARNRTRVAASDAPPAPSPGDAVDADVVMAGGGLWSLLAPLLAKRGLSVIVIERARAATSHREWNASRAELSALVRAGLVTDAELDALIVARYDRGTCRFAGGGDYPVLGVLDNAVDAGALLAHGRREAERLGVTFLDETSVLAHASSDAGVRIRAKSAATILDVSARVLVDARGAASPFASADLVCPTVGGVLEGLVEGSGHDEIDPRVGEILVTTDGVDAGRQHIWEAFPGHAKQTTVYQFYYAPASEPVSLTALYARFFDALPSYKRGDARLVRPTFGLIPGWSRLSPAPRAPDARVVLVGDAAARHSPLTYCGFGATLRSLGAAVDAIEARVHGKKSSNTYLDDRPIHAFTGALAHMLASRAFAGGELNALLDAAFATLHELGQDTYAALLRDEMAPADFVTFLRRTASRHPAVWGHVAKGLGPVTGGRWALRVARSLLSKSA